MSKLVLEIKYGGLGDHLFYSHIPRIAKLGGKYDQVFISTLSAFRHPDYKRLIWEKNPFLDGFIDEPGQYFYFASVENGENILDKHMLLLGLDDGERFHEPELYFEPQINPIYQGLTVYDPNFVSGVGYVHNASGIQQWLKNNKLSVDFQMKLREKNLALPLDKFIETKSLEEFCSLIVSCNRLLCLTSGTATLAAALKKPAIAFFGEGQYKMFHHSKLHQYVKIYNDYSLKAVMVRLLKKYLKPLLAK